MNIQEFRQKYPDYGDLSDRVLANKLYKAHYSDMDRSTFDERVLGVVKVDPVAQAEYESYRSDPSKVLPIIQEAKKMRETVSKQFAKDWRVGAGKAVAQEIGKDISAGPWAKVWEQAGTQESNSLRATLQTAVGLTSGMAAFLAGTVATVANEMKQVVVQGMNAAKGRKFSMNWEEQRAWKKAAESFFEYDVTDPIAQTMLMAIGAIPTGVKAFFDTLSGISQTDKGKEVIAGIADNLPDIPFIEIPREDIQAAVSASLDAAGVIGELAGYGAVFKTVKIPKVPKVVRPAGIPKKPLPTKARPPRPEGGIERLFEKERIAKRAVEKPKKALTAVEKHKAEQLKKLKEVERERIKRLGKVKEPIELELLCANEAILGKAKAQNLLKKYKELQKEFPEDVVIKEPEMDVIGIYKEASVFVEPSKLQAMKGILKKRNIEIDIEHIAGAEIKAIPGKRLAKAFTEAEKKKKPVVFKGKELEAQQLADKFNKANPGIDLKYNVGVQMGRPGEAPRYWFTPEGKGYEGQSFTTTELTQKAIKACLVEKKKVFDVPDLTPEQIKAIGRGEEITLEVGGGQKIYEAIAKRLTKREKKADRKIIEKRERERTYVNEDDIAEIKAIADSKGFGDVIADDIAKGRFEGRKIRDFTREEADAFKLYLIEKDARPILPNFRTIQKDPKISSRITGRLNRIIKTYDVADIELASYIDLFRKGEKITGTETLRMGEFIKTVHELRPGEGRIVMGYLAPVKRILGEKFVAPFRRAALRIFKAQNPYLVKSNKIFRGLNEKNKTAISEHREGQLTREQLTPKELKAANALTKEYNRLWKEFEIDGYIERYNPRLPRFDEKQDLINWAFSRRGIQNFDFWAKHKRTGELFPRETDAEYLFNSYIRSGFKEKFNSIALEEVKSLTETMNPERQTFANKWLDTVIKKRPSVDEKIADAVIKKLFKKAGIKVKGNERYYRNLVAIAMDLNYSAFMGLRPKLGIRNLTQQMLIINEYGLANYLEGRGMMYSKAVRQAMDRSDMLQLRQRQYAVFEEKIGKATEGLGKNVREKMMFMYRAADLNNCRAAFATGYVKARNLAPRATQAELMRAGEKAITNTQWGYGIDLPYIFKTPTGKIVSQYMSWPIWYADHLARIVIERQGAKLGRTIAQAAIVYYLMDRYGIDYSRTVLLGVMPKALGYTAQSIYDIVKMLNAIGTMDMAKIEQAGKRVLKIPLGYTPGYLAARDVKKVLEGRPEEMFIYKKPGEKKTLRTMKRK